MDSSGMLIVLLHYPNKLLVLQGLIQFLQHKANHVNLLVYVFYCDDKAFLQLLCLESHILKQLRCYLLVYLQMQPDYIPSLVFEHKREKTERQWSSSLAAALVSLVT